MIRTKKLTKGNMCYTKIFHVAQERHTVGILPRRPSEYIPQEADSLKVDLSSHFVAGPRSLKVHRKPSKHWEAWRPSTHAHQCLDGVRSTFKKCQKMKIAFPIYNCPLLKRRSGRPDLLSTTVSYVFICSRSGQIATASCMERARIGLNSIVSETHAVASAERDMAPDLQET